jgi:thymidylate kinase
VEEQSTRNLVYKLCQALEIEGVVYCHWKSNAVLDRSARGDNDLDLLVSRANVQLFTDILCRLGFKEARAPAEQQLPGILNYYGYDRDADRLVHVHAHYQLILGHDMTKNYRLPIERPFLESVTQDNLFKIPAPEFELIVFVIRMVLKHSTWDAILGQQGTLSTTERQELEYLQTRVNQAQMYNILKQHLPYVDATLFDDCMQSLQPGCSIWARIKAGQQLQSKLKAHARRSQVPDVCLKLWRRVVRATRRRVFRHLPRKRMASGGAMIALVGGDGAGKSTAVDELYAWLSKDFDTIKVHMGKPPRSWSIIAGRGALKLGRWLGIFPRRKTSVRTATDANSAVFPGYPRLLWHVCTARDRYWAYVKARRFAANGGLVICDRFPLPQVKLMDGPQCDKIVNIGQTNHLIKFLVQAEKRYYQQIMLPELLIVLRVDPEIAVHRKTDEDATSVRARSTEIWELDWQQTPARVIDAGRSRAEVLSDLKSLVWSEL